MARKGKHKKTASTNISEHPSESAVEIVAAEPIRHLEGWLTILPKLGIPHKRLLSLNRLHTHLDAVYFCPSLFPLTKSNAGGSFFPDAGSLAVTWTQLTLRDWKRRVFLAAKSRNAWKTILSTLTCTALALRTQHRTCITW
jgi:hypothetical protein